jgi:hypothetical protein
MIGFLRPFALLLLFFAAAADAELLRRSFLGLQFDLDDRAGPGLLVSGVVPDSTAAVAGMRPGDRLTSIGSIADLRGYDDLRRELGRVRPGERLPLRWYRGRVVHRVAPPLSVLPSETVPDGVVTYHEVMVDGIRQRLILTRPLHPGAGDEVVVFYLQDAGCETVDLWFDPDHTTRRLIDGWASAGFATARLERRGVGDSEGAPCVESSPPADGPAFEAAVRWLAGNGFDRRIVLFGHGQSGSLAPRLSGDPVVGVMVFGAAIRDADFERQWRRVWQPVLAIHGTFDVQSERDDQETIARLTGGKFLAVAGMDHEFRSYHTRAEAATSPGTGIFDPAIVEATVAWIRALRLPERDPQAMTGT